MAEPIFEEGGVALAVDKERHEERLALVFALRGVASDKAWLHWGITGEAARWEAPPQALWPRGTRSFDAHAVQSPFAAGNDGQPTLRLEIPAAWNGRELRFVVTIDDPPRWINNGGSDYALALDVLPRRDPVAALGGDEVQVAELPGGYRLAWHLTQKEGGPATIRLASDLPAPLHLHWGLVERGRRWSRPPEACWPAASQPASKTAVESAFASDEGISQLTLQLDVAQARGLAFVLRHGERWLKQAGRDFYLPLRAEEVAAEPTSELAETIIDAETGRGSWTLMHRFNLCHELIERLPQRVPARDQALATLYVWLRFSALRQLDWQRNYNTKPRELAHAQERLTRQLAALYGRDHGSREMVRLMLGTLGHGTDGQRVRDEILEIMHRHRIKEVTGHFMEEWHQKLHNNTTYDDVVICEGYLAFLRADGDARVFYDYLTARGVTRQRLESYERPIISAPDFRPELKHALLHDFGRYLLTLKRVHEGTDLAVAFERASGQLPHALRQKLERLLRADADDVSDTCRRLVAARHQLQPLLDGGAEARDRLFLDLALDERLRLAVESARQVVAGLEGWLELGCAAAENVALSFESDELQCCARHFAQLRSKTRHDRDWARELYALRERSMRALASLSDRLHATLQPLAALLGKAFGAERFTVELFSEEVVRGRAPFALSATLRGLGAPLRAAAELGAWEVVSRGDATGALLPVDALRELMRDPPREACIALCGRVDGDEEIPPSVVGVITGASVDLVSHVAVRARNAGVLFVTAHEDDALDALAQQAGQRLRVTIDSSGSARWEDATDQRESLGHRGGPRPSSAAPPTPLTTRKTPSAWALGEEEYDEARVGAKARNLARLRRALGDSTFSVPHAFAIPFGSCERALALCPALKKEHDALLDALAAAPHEQETALFGQLRQLLTRIAAPAELPDALRAAAAHAAVPWPATRWSEIWTRITSVWASKWNERASRARRARGMDDDQLMMAVLVQQLVPADLAFVLHTVDPRHGDDEVLYGELVVGLGETLVGNHPGRALSFVGNKKSLEIELLAFPSKSYALRGSGLIFRSDSSGEDLAGYAGAGLYDSFPLDECEANLIDYTRVPELNDAAALRELLRGLICLGVAIEECFGAPQDVEGAVQKKSYHVVQTRPQVGLDER